MTVKLTYDELRALQKHVDVLAQLDSLPFSYHVSKAQYKLEQVIRPLREMYEKEFNKHVETDNDGQPIQYYVIKEGPQLVEPIPVKGFEGELMPEYDWAIGTRLTAEAQKPGSTWNVWLANFVTDRFEVELHEIPESLAVQYQGKPELLTPLYGTLLQA